MRCKFKLVVNYDNACIDSSIIAYIVLYHSLTYEICTVIVLV